MCIMTIVKAWRNEKEEMKEEENLKREEIILAKKIL